MAQEGSLLRLYPEPAAPVAVEALYSALDWASPAARPFLALNMVSSVDGRAAANGSAAGIGSRIDASLMRELRARVDAVLHGVGTLRAEAFVPTVPDALAAAREARGQSRQPLAVLVTGSGRLPLDRPYFRQADQSRVVVTTAAGAAAMDPAALASVRVLVAGETSVDLAAAAATLRGEHGVRTMLCEGGPTLNHALLAAGIVDELFLTFAPKLLGPTGPSIVEGTPFGLAGAIPLRLLALHAAGDELFLRYGVAARAAAAASDGPGEED